MWTPLRYLELRSFYDNACYEVLTIEIDQDSLLNALTVWFVLRMTINEIDHCVCCQFYNFDSAAFDHSGSFTSHDAPPLRECRVITTLHMMHPLT